ncbi:GNAT family N-acetyltransferase, partial [Bacillus thuringiensis]|nr:GNAT family N-acetyltransferase [Bacillus thuringiensis]
MLRLIQAIGGQFYMIQYKRCSEVNIDLVYEAFKDGFSDYIIKMEVSKEG